MPRSVSRPSAIALAFLLAALLVPSAARAMGWTVTLGGHQLTPWAGLPAAEPTFRVAGDFDGNGRTDLATYDQGTGTWTASLGRGRATPYAQFVTTTGWTAAHAGDFNGDRRDDIAVFHPASGRWWVITGPGQVELWADYDDGGWTLTAAGDFNGDGRDDVGAYAPSNGTWWITTGKGAGATLWGTAVTKTGWTHAVSGNFDGDRADEIAWFHDGLARWWVWTGQNQAVQYADFSPDGGYDLPAVGDVNGDGRDDIATFHRPSGRWLLVTGQGQQQLWADIAGIAGRSGWTGSAVADVTGDRRGDVLAFNGGSSRWWAITGQGVARLWADLEPDGDFRPGPAGNFDGGGAADVSTLFTGSGLPRALALAPTTLSKPRSRARGRGRMVRITVRGALGIPAGVPRDRACRGAVQISVASARRLVTVRRAKLARRCAYRKAIRFPRRKVKRRKIAVRVVFGGNRYLRGTDVTARYTLKKIKRSKKKR